MNIKKQAHLKMLAAVLSVLDKFKPVWQAITAFATARTAECQHDWKSCICIKCGLWRTQDIRIEEAERAGDYKFVLVDKSLYHLFKENYPIGGKLENEKLSTLAHVIAPLFSALERWRMTEPTAWGDGAIKELSYLPGFCAHLGGNTSSSKCICAPDRINAVANSFVDILRNHPEIRPKFGSGYFTVWNICISFGNTLGCGGALGTAMQWY